MGILHLSHPISNTQYPVPNLRQAERTAGVSPTHTWLNFYGPATWPDAADTPLAVGTVVLAVAPGDVVCGATAVTRVGQYGLLPCYGDDPATPLDEGAQPGDVIRLLVAGQTLGEAVWTGDRARRWLLLGEAGDMYRYYLPIILQSGGAAEAERQPAALPPARRWLPLIGNADGVK